MPIQSKAQERLMQGVKNNPEFAKKVGIPKKVGAEFVKAGKAELLARYPDGKINEASVCFKKANFFSISFVKPLFETVSLPLPS